MRFASVLCVLVSIGFGSVCRGSIQIIADYRLGEDDPGAGPGNIGQNPTFDRGPNHLNLTREGTPHYSSDVGASGSTVSMRFNPATLDVYYYPEPVSMLTDNVGLEAWVKASTKATGIPLGIVAYNGAPGVDGFGLIRIEDSTPFGGLAPVYEGVLGNSIVGLVAVPDETWMHLAIVKDGGVSTFYVNGVPAGSSVEPAEAETMAFTVGASYCPVCDRPIDSADYLDGLVDEVRVFSFSVGKFDASSDLSFQAVPEPYSIGWIMLGATLLLRLRSRPGHES